MKSKLAEPASVSSRLSSMGNTNLHLRMNLVDDKDNEYTIIYSIKTFDTLIDLFMLIDFYLLHFVLQYRMLLQKT